MSIDPRQSPDPQHRHSEHQHRQADTDRDIRYVAARVEQWLSSASGEDPPAQPESLDSKPRHRDVVNPSATRIGTVADPDDDLDARLRDLHAERTASLAGHSERQHRLDIARLTQALCNSLDLTTWERDRVLGVVSELDCDAFDDTTIDGETADDLDRDEDSVDTRQSLPRLVLVVARRVVDAEREAWLGLDDAQWRGQQPPERLQALSDRLHRLTDSDEFKQLQATFGLGDGEIPTLEEALDRELDDETLETAVFGRSPYRDPALPSFRHHGQASPREQ